MTVSVRFVLFGATLVLVSMVALLLSASTAGAQDRDAELRVTIRYPDGSAVTDADVCLEFYGASPSGEGAFFAGGSEFPVAQTTTVPVFSGGTYKVRATPCQGSMNKIASIWHDGSPWGLRDRLVAINRNGIFAKPGVNQVDITVSRSTIRGRVNGLGESQDCRIVVKGASSAKPNNYGEVENFQTEGDGTFEFAVPPGEYTLQSECSGPRAIEYYPSGSKLAQAQTVRLAHNQTLSNVNFDMTGDGGDEVGAFLFVFLSEHEAHVPVCLEVYDAGGALVARESKVFPTFRGAVVSTYVALWTYHNGAFTAKVTDCLGYGFPDQWYPGVPSAAQAQSVTIAGGEFDVYLPTEMNVLGGSFSCDGMPATTFGSTRSDILTGSNEADVIVASSGNDIVYGLQGDDIICAGDGSDHVFGNAGDDWIDAGAGADWVGAGWGEDIVFGGAGNDFIRGFKHNDTIEGGTGNDRITGGWGNDILRGGPGNDTLRAYFGADKLFGNAGNDALVAGNGPDFLVGGPGAADRLFGDQGRDICNDVGPDSQFTDCETIN